MDTITLKTGLTIGEKSPIRVNCNVGCNRLADYQYEIDKLQFLKHQNIMPDVMMDLSLVACEHPIYETIRDELKLPFGTVLSYSCFNMRDGLLWSNIKPILLRLCDDGISFVTIHFTADSDLFEIANRDRLIPVTSRGGGIVLYDTIKNHRVENIFREHIDDIIAIVKSYDVAISLGTTFRPGSISDACDEAHLEETKRQLAICRYLQSNGVSTIVENIGHISLDKLTTHAEMLRLFNAPIMPLGPLPTDSAINQDHIANAIGSAVSGYYGITNIINSVTRYEHSQSVITPEATLEAIRVAKIAAHIADISRGIESAKIKDYGVSQKRGKSHNCFADGSECTRCNDVCPLKLMSNG